MANSSCHLNGYVTLGRSCNPNGGPPFVEVATNQKDSFSCFLRLYFYFIIIRTVKHMNIFRWNKRYTMDETLNLF
jgi:hypothetical protein